ncbi:MAG TPA: hypothetical protein VK668_17050 [Mucilaginibacter sp.]|nr:hypothetical protein [Mucilaginibacter sp.]
MIDPENEIPLDDAEDSDKEDQMSQQDIHSNGFDENFQPADDNTPNTDKLQQASDASEPSYTLNVDKGFAPKAGNNDKKE